MTYDTTGGITTVRWDNQTSGREFFFTVTVDGTLAENETREYINEAIMITAIDQLEMPTNKTYHHTKWSPRNATLTISKEVTGDLGNRVMEFDFKIFFRDPNGNPLLPGTKLRYSSEAYANPDGTAPTGGTLILDNSGSGSFSLAHGQAIRIEDVPLGGSVQIIETKDNNYQTWFTGSEYPEDRKMGNDTGMQLMTKDRSFHFENERNEVPLTGISLSGLERALLQLALSVQALVMMALPIGQGRHKRAHN